MEQADFIMLFGFVNSSYIQTRLALPRLRSEPKTHAAHRVRGRPCNLVLLLHGREHLFALLDARVLFGCGRLGGRGRGGGRRIFHAHQAQKLGRHLTFVVLRETGLLPLVVGGLRGAAVDRRLFRAPNQLFLLHLLGVLGVGQHGAREIRQIQREVFVFGGRRRRRRERRRRGDAGQAAARRIHQAGQVGVVGQQMGRRRLNLLRHERRYGDAELMQLLHLLLSPTLNHPIDGLGFAQRARAVRHGRRRVPVIAAVVSVVGRLLLRRWLMWRWLYLLAVMTTLRRPKYFRFR